MNKIKTPELAIIPRHGSAQDRGSADAYYGRPAKPHYYSGGSFDSPAILEADMTKEEISLYHKAFSEEGDRKSWF